MLICLTVWSVPVAAFAHPTVDEGKRLMQRARFGQALEAFASAEEEGGLSRSDVIEIYDARCLIYHATRRAEQLDAAITALGSIRPNHEFSAEAPPELQELFDAQTHRPLRLEVDAVRQGQAFRFDTSVTNDPGSLVMRIVVFVDPGDGEFLEVDAPVRPLERTVRYYAEAIGPGGAVLGSIGSAENPEVERSPPATTSIQTEVDEDEGISGWVIVGIAGAVAAIAAEVVVVLVVTAPDAETQPQFPTVVGF